MNKQRSNNCLSLFKQAIAICLLLFIWSLPAISQSPLSDNLFNTSRFYLTNSIRRGTDGSEFPKIMGHKVGRVALFSIPLQQQWSYRVDGDHAPTYYLNSVTSLNYYSFSEASIARAYRSLPEENQARFDPMITHSNSTDICGADHLRRVLPDRFLFGAAKIAPADQKKSLRVYQPYEPFWALLKKRANEKAWLGI